MRREKLIRLQEMQLEIMDEIHRICVLNNISYYMIGGTGIGAIRHKGFIPWDVDIDIAMFRNDYDRFKQICEYELNPKFKYWDYLNTHDFTRPHSLISLKGTSLSTKYDKYNRRVMDFGVYVDVFPLDNAPNSVEERKKHGENIWKLKMKKEYKLATCYDDSILKRTIKEVRRLLMFWTTVDKLNHKLDSEMRKYNSTSTEYVCNMAGKYTYETECAPRDYFGTPTLMNFESRVYFAPERLGDYLTHVYGDYQKLPSQQEQLESLSYFENVTINS